MDKIQNKYLKGLAKALDSNFDWLVASLYDNIECTDLYDADSETKAFQLYRMGFTHKTENGYERTHADVIQSMIDEYDESLD